MGVDRSLRGQLAITVGLILIGVLILFAPSSWEGQVAIPISEGHGLSGLDLAGAIVVAVGGTWLEVLVVWSLPRLALPPRGLFGVGLLAGLGIGLVLASAFSGFFWWWAIGAGAFGVAALILVPLMARR